MSDTQLRELLTEAQAKIREQHEFIEQITGPPNFRTNVIAIMSGSPIIVVDGRVVEAACPAEVKKQLRPGTPVNVHPENFAITGLAPGSLDIGDIKLVSRIRNEGVLEVEAEDGPKLVYFSAKLFPDVKEGHQVILDDSSSVVVNDLGPERSRFALEKDTGVQWSDIGGLEAQKEMLKEAISTPLMHPKLFEAYGLKRLKGALLEGPPGCGKTMLAKAAATELAKTHGVTDMSGFIYIKGPEILSKWVGQSEATIRGIFRTGRKHKEETGHPALIFIDEAEAILSHRGRSVSSDMEKTIVPQFLAEMDGLSDSGCFCLLATNRADRLDSAVVRDGRIDRTVRVPRPDKDQAKDIFEIYLKNKPFENGYSVEELAEHCAEEVYSDERVLYMVGRRGGEASRFTLSGIANGALCEGIVSRATSLALHKDISRGKKAKATGISKDDLNLAIDQVMVSNESLDHSLAIEERFGREITGIQKVSSRV